MLENLITDRKASDVQRWRVLRDKGYENMTEAEKTEWSGGLKGSYNVTDLNRVGNALKNLRERLIEAGYLTGIEFIPKTDWDSLDIPITVDFTAYLNAVEVIREALSQKSTTPPVPPDTESLDYEGANNIEKILIDIDELITLMQTLPCYCGELYGGEL